MEFLFSRPTAFHRCRLAFSSIMRATYATLLLTRVPNPRVTPPHARALRFIYSWECPLFLGVSFVQEFSETSIIRSSRALSQVDISATMADVNACPVAYSR